MGPSRGDTICGEVVIEALGPMHFGALALGPIHIARTPTEPKLWLSTVERTLLPRSADISRFMAGVGELARVALPGAVPLVLVDREADFCVVGYRAIEGAQTLAQLIERGEDEPAALSMAGALARTLAEFHRRGFVHGLVTASTVLRAAGTWWTWQYGIAGMCAPDRLAPRLRPPGGDPVAPELRAGAGVSPAADVFGWGAAMACLLTGAIGSDAISLLLDDEREDPLRNLVRDCLEAVPELRPRDGATLLAKLQAALSGAAATSPSESSTEISFADLNDGLDDIEDGSRFGLPGDPPSLAGETRAPAVTRAAAPPVAGADDPSVVELMVLGPDDGLDDEPPAAHGTTPAQEQELARVRAVHGDAAWRELAEQYLSEHPPSAEEVDALPVQELVVPSPLAPDPKRGALGRVALIRTRVRTGPQKPVRPDVNGCAGTFEMPEEPEREPPAPRVAADARELPLGSDDDEEWDDPDAAVFDLDAPAGPERVDVDEEAVDMDWPVEEPPAVDPRGATWPADPHPAPTHARFVKLGADEDTPAHPTPLAWLENNDEPLPPSVPVGRAGASSSELELELPARGPGLVLDREHAPIPARASTPASSKPARTASPEPPPERVAKREPAASASQPHAPAPVVVGTVVPAKSAIVRAPVTPLSPAALAPERVRRARSGNAVAVAFAAGTGALALVATLGLARHRGGIAQLLGVVAGSPPEDTETPVEAPARDAAPTPVVAPAPPPRPQVCPDEMRPIDASTCIDRGEFPGLSEIPRTQVAHAEAAQACEDRGARLCSTQEWRRACKGPGNLRHPYGARAELDRCNGASASGAVQDLSRSGARDACVTESGVFDLEGNVAEWVSEAAALGGDSATRSPSCDTRVKPSAQTRAATLGFRCCMSLDTSATAPGA